MQQATENQKPGFDALGLSEESLTALERVEYETPSPIQAAFLPVALKGTDCIGQAHTGTGKTAAFVLPILERIDLDSGKVEALILTPTRELSEQVSREAQRLSMTRSCHSACLVGGRPIRQQIEQLRKSVQIAVGTPGRVIDLMNRRELDLRHLKVVVLDEADRMLDIGFRPDIEKILRRCPRERQTMLLSATLPPPVERLAQRFMQNPTRIDLSSDQVYVDSVNQYYVTVDEDRKLRLLVHVLLVERPRQALVFTRTKRRADDLYKKISRKLTKVDHLHGDLPQSKRDRVMQKFREGKVRLLIATDVMGRGIDVSGISHIINYDIPEYCDDYVHRIGRTGRLSSDDKGSAFTFVTKEQGSQLTSIEMRLNRQLDEFQTDGFDAFRPKPPPKRLETEEGAQKTHVA